jgi:activated CDC42 kinase 1
LLNFFVTLGFQPWAALTGQQILDAIDEPNYQRLEKPECCPHEIYYQIMLKCWQHDAISRPSFVDLSIHLLPEVRTLFNSTFASKINYRG